MRLDDDATKHTFSKHDNRQIFLNDPTLFGSGLGKKKIDSINKSKWNPELIAWREKTVSTEANKQQQSNQSMYQHDFCKFFTNSKLLAGRKNLETKPVSVYEYAFSHGEPKPELSKSVRLETYHRFMNKSANAKLSSQSDRLTVANCLVWQNNAPVRVSSSHTESNLSEPQNNSRPNPDTRPKTVAACSNAENSS